MTASDAILCINAAYKSFLSLTIAKSFPMAGFPKLEVEVENRRNQTA